MKQALDQTRSAKFIVKVIYMKVLKLLGSAALIILGLWGIFAGVDAWSSDDGLMIVVASVLGILAGIGILFPNVGRDEEVEQDVPDSVTVSEQMQEDTPPVDEGQQKVQFMVTRNHSDEGLDAVERLLSEDKRVLSMGRDEGRHYSVPDGDDLPEWFSIHVSCNKKDLEALMADLETQMKAELDDSIVNAIEIGSL